MPATSGRKRRQGGEPAADGPPADAKEIAAPGGGTTANRPAGFAPVCCQVCDYGVGYRSSQDGIYHFTDVLASES